MHPRISIRGSVCPSVRPSVHYASSDITQMTHRVARLGLFFSGSPIIARSFLFSLLVLSFMKSPSIVDSWYHARFCSRDHRCRGARSQGTSKWFSSPTASSSPTWLTYVLHLFDAFITFAKLFYAQACPNKTQTTFPFQLFHFLSLFFLFFCYFFSSSLPSK